MRKKEASTKYEGVLQREQTQTGSNSKAFVGGIANYRLSYMNTKIKPFTQTPLPAKPSKNCIILVVKPMQKSENCCTEAWITLLSPEEMMKRLKYISTHALRPSEGGKRKLKLRFVCAHVKEDFEQLFKNWKFKWIEFNIINAPYCRENKTVAFNIKQKLDKIRPICFLSTRPKSSIKLLKLCLLAFIQPLKHLFCKCLFPNSEI